MIRIYAPGEYALSADEYHADPCPEPSLSSSIAKLLLDRSPLHAWTAHPWLNPDFKRETSRQFDLGAVAHAIMLGSGDVFVVIDAADYRTKAAQEARAAAYAAGLIPVLPDQLARVEAMVRAARRQLEAHEDAAGVFRSGTPESTLVWQEGDTWCRCRLDWRPDPLEPRHACFDDYKTTAASAEPNAWSRQLFSLGYDIQAAFYARGIEKILGTAEPIFRFVVQEVEPPYALSVISLPPHAVEIAAERVAEAIDIWRTCLRTGNWPGYPTRTAWVEPPGWYLAAWEERKARMQPERSRVETAIAWQAPLNNQT